MGKNKREKDVLNFSLPSFNKKKTIGIQIRTKRQKQRPMSHKIFQKEYNYMTTIRLIQTGWTWPDGYVISDRKDLSGWLPK